MRMSTRILFLLALLVAVLVFVLTGPSPAAHRQQPFASAAGSDGSVQLPDRRLDASTPAIAPTMTAGDVQASITVTVTSTGPHAFAVRPDHFTLSAEGDMFGQGDAPGSTGTLTGTVGPGVSRAGHLRFVVPRAALRELTLLYHPRGQGLVASIPLSGASTAPAATGAAPTSLAASVPLVEAAGFSMTSNSATGTNTIEDTFARPNQTGWGTTTNPDGVPNVTWGMDGQGAKSYVTISNNTGPYGYPGSTNVVGIASSGSTTYNGGDSLVKFAVSAVGHVTPYVVQNACGNKSCYYGARLHTSQNKLEIAKRSGDATSILASVPFTASANTYYWLRLDVTTGSTDTLQAKIWANGTPEPSSWMVTATDTSPLAANLLGAGGSWDQTGTGESIQYMCYAYAASGLAAPCGTGPVPTPAPTATATPVPPTATLTATPIAPTTTATATPGGPTPTASSTPGPAGAAASDNFNRTVSSGWASTDTGGWWTVVGSPWQWSVSPGAGSVSVAAGKEERAYLSSFTIQNVDIVEQVVLPQSTQSSNHTLAYVIARYQPAYSPTYYRVGIGQDLGTSTIILRAQRSDNTSLASDVSTGIPVANNAVIWLHVLVQGTNPTTVRARAWANGTSEPSTWQLSATDSNGPEQQAGMVGVHLRNDDTAAAHTFQVASFQATGSATPVAQVANPTGSAQYFYVVTDGTLSAYDIANGHALVKQVPIPIAGKRGVMAAPTQGLLYITECGNRCGGANGSLLAYNLLTDQVAWIANYSFGADQGAITPDGRTIYMSHGADASDGTTTILDASHGQPIGSINTGTNGHNTVASLDGSEVFLTGFGGSNYNYIHVTSTSTNQVTKNVGPVINGVRPFTVNGRDTLAFTTSSNTCGFQVVNLTSGQVLYTVSFSGSCSWTVSTAPSHGISLSPDETQVYVMDGPLDVVEVYDVSGLPTSAPVPLATIPVSSLSGQESPCQSWCEREGWVLHSLSGRYLYVGDAGDVIDTTTRQVVAHLPTLTNTRIMIEVDWANGRPSATSTRFGLGRVTR